MLQISHWSHLYLTVKDLTVNMILLKYSSLLLGLWQSDTNDFSGRFVTSWTFIFNVILWFWVFLYFFLKELFQERTLRRKGSHSFLFKMATRWKRGREVSIMRLAFKRQHSLIIGLYQEFAWRRQWHPTPVLLPGKSHARRSLVGCSPWDMTEWLHFHLSLSCIGEGTQFMGSQRVGLDWSDLAVSQTGLLTAFPNIPALVCVCARVHTHTRSVFTASGCFLLVETLSHSSPSVRTYLLFRQEKSPTSCIKTLLTHRCSKCGPQTAYISIT